MQPTNRLVYFHIEARCDETGEWFSRQLVHPIWHWEVRVIEKRFLFWTWEKTIQLPIDVAATERKTREEARASATLMFARGFWVRITEVRQQGKKRTSTICWKNGYSFKGMR